MVVSLHVGAGIRTQVLCRSSKPFLTAELSLQLLMWQYFLNILFLIMCVCVFVGAYGYSAQGVHNRVCYTGARVRSGCEPLKWVVESQLWSPAKEVCTLDH